MVCGIGRVRRAERNGGHGAMLCRLRYDGVTLPMTLDELALADGCASKRRRRDSPAAAMADAQVVVDGRANPPRDVVAH